MISLAKALVILLASPLLVDACVKQSSGTTSKISSSESSGSTRGKVTFGNDIRFHGAGGNYGIVEVLYNNEWGTICDEALVANPSLGQDTAEAICSFLGQPGPAVWFSFDAGNIPSDFSGVQQSPASTVWLESFYCYGTESNVDQCQHARPGHKHNDCSSSQNLGVACNYAPDAPILVFVSHLESPF